MWRLYDDCRGVCLFAFRDWTMELMNVIALCAVCLICGYFSYPVIQRIIKEKGKMKWES